KDAQLAKDNEVFLEITTRGGHSLGNGLVADLALKAGAKLILNIDAHQPRDFISESSQEKTALGAGIPISMFEEVFVKNSEQIIRRIMK
ncbi:MAG: histidinol phosphate phosphatase domain-containing protein, partial [Candidatus Heimdallarchaeaceae archaeon]